MRVGAWMLYGTLGLLFAAFAALALGALVLQAGGHDVEEGTRLWVAAGIGLTVAGLLPLVVAVRFGAHAVSGLRIFGGLNLVVTLALLAFLPSATRLSLHHHGAWPFALAGEEVSAPVDLALAALVDALPGDPIPASAPAAPVAMSPEQVFVATADSVVFVGVRKGAEPDSLEARLMKDLGLHEVQGHGSGFVVSEDGLIVTNHHVAGGATSAVVRFKDGREVFDVEVVAEDPANDLALLRVKAPGLKPVRLAPAGEVPVGSAALAIGSPLGLDFTLTSGIVSAHRELQGTSMLQMQTAIAPGSSGGPLFNDRGEVVGVNTATRGLGMNLAVHVKHVRALVSGHARDEGRVLAPWRPDVALASLDFEGIDPLPTERATVEQVTQMVVRVVEGCRGEDAGAGEGAADVVTVRLPARAARGPATVTSSLGKGADACLQRPLRFVSWPLAQVLGEAPAGASVKAAYERPTGGEGGAAPRRLEVRIELPAKG